jgi:ligand-binding sensor domain-containing protein
MANRIAPKVLFLFCFLFSFATLEAQETGSPVIRNYATKEYQGAPQVFSAIQDNRGILYFTSGSSILEYDGTYWRNIPNPRQKDYLHFAKDSSGTIYVGGMNEFGYLATDKTGNTIYHSLTHLLHNTINVGFVWVVGVTSTSVCFITFDAIFQHSPGTENIEILTTSPDNLFLDGFVFRGELYVQQAKTGLCKVIGNELVSIPQSDFFADRNVFRTALPFDSVTIMVPTRTEGLYVFNPHENKIPVKFPISDKDFLANNNIFTAYLFQNEYFILGSANKGALLIDKKGNVVQRYHENNLQNNTVRSMMGDKNQNIWFGLGNGISKAENTLDISYWDKNSGLKGSVYSVIRFEGTIYIATSLKVYYLDENSRVQEVANIPVGHNWCFMEHKESQSLLAGSRYGVYSIKKGVASKIMEGMHAAKLYQSVTNTSRIFTPVLPDFMSFRYESGQWINEGVWEGIKDQIRGVVEDKNGDLWLGTYRNGVIRVTPNPRNISKPLKVRYYTQEDGFLSLTDILPFRYNNQIIWGSGTGIYHYNPESDRFEPFHEWNAQFSKATRSIFSLAQTNDGKIWICPKENSKDDIGYLQPIDSVGYEWVFAPFRRIPELLIETFYVEPTGIVWIGGSEGLFRYNPNKDTKNYRQPFHCFVRTVTVGVDSLLFAGNADFSNPQFVENVRVQGTFDICFTLNSLKFQFSAPFFDREEKTLYSHKLEGFDNHWSHWSRQTEKEYTDLREGTYTFQVKARNVYDVESSIGAVQITILPPWYRTWWAFLIYAALLFLTVRGIVKFYNRLLIEQKKRLENIVKEKTGEILQQKEELVTINDELKSVNEEILQQREELEITLQSLKETQKQLIQSEKMASIGVLTAGIAHEINNPMNFVSAGINSIIRDFHDVEQVLQLLEDSIKTQQPPDQIVQQIAAKMEEVEFSEALAAIKITMKDILQGAQRTGEIVQGLYNQQNQTRHFPERNVR